MRSKVMIAVALGLTSCTSSARHESRAVDADREGVQPTIEFVVTPVIAHGGMQEGPDTIWSAGEDLDSVLVILRGAPDTALVEISLDAALQVIDLTDPPRESPRRTIQWKTLPATRLATLPNGSGGRIVAVILPSELEGDSDLLRKNEAAIELSVHAKFSTGAEIVSHLRLLPGI